ncbi:MAG TPA: hypothetical protein VMU26_12885 [Candidatus Polarisedimenticolia bacterium]|nr:hypothetical protein [Candidatus Polarisedimenticolia bacterium]
MRGLDLLPAGEFAGATPVSGEEPDHGEIRFGLPGAQHNALAVTRMNMTDFIHSSLAGLMK